MVIGLANSDLGLPIPILIWFQPLKLCGTCPPITIPLRQLRLQRLFKRPSRRPDERAKANYFAAW